MGIDLTIGIPIDHKNGGTGYVNTQIALVCDDCLHDLIKPHQYDSPVKPRWYRTSEEPLSEDAYGDPIQAIPAHRLISAIVDADATQTHTDGWNLAVAELLKALDDNCPVYLYWY